MDGAEYLAGLVAENYSTEPTVAFTAAEHRKCWGNPVGQVHVDLDTLDQVHVLLAQGLDRGSGFFARFGECEYEGMERAESLQKLVLDGLRCPEDAEIERFLSAYSPRERFLLSAIYDTVPFSRGDE